MATRRPPVRRESATAVRAEAIETPPECAAEILERCLEFSVEELAPRNDHEIDRGIDSDPRRESDLGSEHLSNQPFCSVSIDSAAELSGGDQAETR